jgi:hypothetical protein
MLAVLNASMVDGIVTVRRADRRSLAFESLANLQCNLYVSVRL